MLMADHKWSFLCGMMTILTISFYLNQKNGLN